MSKEHLEPAAEQILSEIKTAIAMGNKDGHPPDTQVHLFSAAVSLKRIADALWGVDGQTAGLLELLNPLQVRNNY